MNISLFTTYLKFHLQKIIFRLFYSRVHEMMIMLMLTNFDLLESFERILNDTKISKLIVCFH